ncbi:MAG: MATE family efflux transporter [Oscillospiraceae bacterium]|jgi:putative MATE family efflux protein|nr:MATE family efflux transporter [Oscillospiraceae bacterium]
MKPNAAPDNPLGVESIRKLVVKFSIPAVVSFLISSIYNVVDQIYIGHGIGEFAMAATTVSFPLTTASVALTLLFGTGGAAVFNLNLGRGDEKTASKAAANALFMLASTGLLLMVVTLFFCRPLLFAFGATESVMSYSVPYTRLVAIGFPLQAVAAGAGLIIRADGSPRFSMVSVLVGSIFNVIFDPIFAFTLKMGIVGIALATTVGQVLSFAIVMFYLLRRTKTMRLTRDAFFPLNPRIIGRVIAVGAAACLNQVAMMFVQITMNNGVRKYGAVSEYGSEIPLAAVGAITKVQVLFLSVILGISQGVQPIISFNYGARNIERVKKTVKTALTAVVAASVFTFACYQLFPAQIMALFGTKDPLYLQFAVMYLRTYMLMSFAAGLQPFATYFFSATGKSRLGIALTLTRQIVLLVPLLLLLPLAFGVRGLLYAGPISDGGAAVLAVTLIVREWRKLKRLEA